ncbi:MAG: hypothetical protein R6X20_00360 [Phycisphaerae bacterium]
MSANRKKLPVMKRRYWLAALVAMGLLVVYIFLSALWPDCKYFAQVVHALSGFAAVAAGIIALGVADRPLLPIEIISHDPYLGQEDNDRAVRYVKAGAAQQDPEERVIPAKWLKPYRGYPDHFTSFRVYFAFTNDTGRPLKKPVITLRVPKDRRHPAVPGDGKYWLSLNNTLTPISAESGNLAMGSRIVLWNQALPYWHDGERLEDVYVRMVLDNGKSDRWEAFRVIVSVDSENARGWSKNLKVDPRGLLQGTPWQHMLQSATGI